MDNKMPSKYPKRKQKLYEKCLKKEAKPMKKDTRHINVI